MTIGKQVPTSSHRVRGCISLFTYLFLYLPIYLYTYLFIYILTLLSTHCIGVCYDSFTMAQFTYYSYVKISKILYIILIKTLAQSQN